MAFKPQYDTIPKQGTVVISYLDPIQGKITSLVHDNVSPDLLAQINRLLRSR